LSEWTTPPPNKGKDGCERSKIKEMDRAAMAGHDSMPEPFASFIVLMPQHNAFYLNIRILSKSIG
jgi:hypothetical protein